MPIYTVGGTSAAAATTAAYASFNATTRRTYVREIGFFTTAATASSVGIGTPANNNSVVGTSAITPVTHNPETAVSDTAATANFFASWSTPPTAPSVYMRKCTLAASVGQGVIWKLAPDERIVLGFTTNKQFLTFQNYAGTSGSALDMYVMYEE